MTKLISKISLRVSLFLSLALYQVTASDPVCQVISGDGEDITEHVLYRPATLPPGCGLKCKRQRDKEIAELRAKGEWDEPYIPDLIENGEESLVMCWGDEPKWCKNATISNCDIVDCQGGYSCYQTHMINITQQVRCEGKYSCHQNQIEMEAKDWAYHGRHADFQQSVHCNGATSCDGVTISTFGDHDHIAGDRQSTLTVTCNGSQACKKAHIKAATVECTQGDSLYPACSDFTVITAKCLLCGHEGCHSHVNHCKYSVWNQPDEVSCPLKDYAGLCTAAQISKLEEEIKQAAIVASVETDEADSEDGA